MLCGSCAVEGALKAAFLARRARERGANVDFTKEEIASCMNNQTVSLASPMSRKDTTTYVLILEI